MLFNVPQFIDKEDKIVGPFTGRQLGWMAGAGTIMLVLWALLDISAFIIASIPVIGIFGAFAFYHPNGQPFIAFVFSTFRFMSRPKMYVWRRVPEKIFIPKKVTAKTTDKTLRKEIDEKKIKDISNLLNTK